MQRREFCKASLMGSAAALIAIRGSRQLNLTTIPVTFSGST